MLQSTDLRVLIGIVPVFARLPEVPARLPFLLPQRKGCIDCSSASNVYVLLSLHLRLVERVAGAVELRCPYVAGILAVV